MGSTRRHFTEEYKANAVSLVLDDGRTNAEVARSLGIHEMTFGKWVKKEREYREADKDPDAELDESERAELNRLRQENKQARAENADLQMRLEFAKKVATWFAKDQP